MFRLNKTDMCPTITWGMHEVLRVITISFYGIFYASIPSQMTWINQQKNAIWSPPSTPSPPICIATITMLLLQSFCQRRPQDYFCHHYASLLYTKFIAPNLSKTPALFVSENSFYTATVNIKKSLIMVHKHSYEMLLLSVFSVCVLSHFGKQIPQCPFTFLNITFKRKNENPKPFLMCLKIVSLPFFGCYTYLSNECEGYRCSLPVWPDLLYWR